MLTPIIKYPGGKERELPIILNNLPKHTIANYYDPFVGGGSVYLAMSEIISGKCFINDKSFDLINLYNMIKNTDATFYALINKMDRVWLDSESIAEMATPYLWHVYSKKHDCYAQDLSLQQVSQNLASYFDDPQIFSTYLIECLLRKLNYCFKNKQNGLELSDFSAIMMTAYKSAIYMYYRYLYNLGRTGCNTLGERAAIYLFLRQYAYNSMFRFSKSGNFNVPYGGQSYNKISLARKYDYYHDSELLNQLDTTEITNLDFVNFLQKHHYQQNDFIFIDPPYDSPFSQYDNLAFDQNMQHKLANILIKQVNTNWMAVINDTPFIRSIYPQQRPTANKKQINYVSFAKTYNTNLRNRNQRQTKLLVITNY